MSTRRTQWLLSAALLLVATGVPIQAIAQGNPYYEACKTLDGVYEERRTGCDPECETTYICQFSDGSGRICDEQGSCGSIGETSVGNATAAAPSEKTPESDSTASDSSFDEAIAYESYDECVGESSDECKDRCSGKSRRDALDCGRACVEDLCGDYEGTSSVESSEATASTSDSSSSECSECESACRQECSSVRGPRQKRECADNCSSKCKAVCD